VVLGCPFVELIEEYWARGYLVELIEIYLGIKESKVLVVLETDGIASFPRDLLSIALNVGVVYLKLNIVNIAASA
jgi:hypothetical protein